MSFLRSIIVLSLSLTLLACSGSSSNGGDPGTGEVTTNFKSLSSGDVTEALSVGLPFALNDYGAAAVGAGGLSSFKLYVSSIQFCESIEVNGSGYNSPTNCSTVYENGTEDYATFDVAAASAVSTGKYFDLLTADGRVGMRATATLEPGTYNVGIINWYRPIKIKATVPLQNGNSLYTKTCPMMGDCEVSDMDTAPAQESIVDFNNGGTWMKFLKPLVITGDEDFTIDLAYDLEKRVFGGQDVSNGQITQGIGCTAVTNGNCGIYMPILRLMPIAHRAAETTMVETYEMSGPSAQWKLRVDVYYNSGDEDKAILGADLFPIPTTSVDSSVAAGAYVYTVTETGGVTTFKDADGTNQLFDFTRGDSGTARLKCPSGATLAGCTAGSNVDVTWTTRTIRSL